jgi:hypothetical protein
MRIQNWHRWLEESRTTGETLRRFSGVVEKNRGYAYEAGWLSSAYHRVLMSLPRAQREQELGLIEAEIKRLEAEQIMSALTKKETV